MRAELHREESSLGILTTDFTDEHGYEIQTRKPQGILTAHFRSSPLIRISEY
jgi:hypothetical protein